MSVRKAVEIRCDADGCGVAGVQGDTAAQARKVAKGQGWVVSHQNTARGGTTDLCPVHKRPTHVGTADCSVCGRRNIKISQTGRFRAHKRPRPPGSLHMGQRCEGSYTTPKPQEGR